MIVTVLMVAVSTGSEWGTPFKLPSDPSGNPWYIQQGMDSSGNIVMVWNQTNESSGLSDIWANRYWSSNDTWGTPTLIEFNSGGNAIRQRLAIDPSGDGMAVWQYHSGTQWSIYYSRYFGDSNTWGAATLLESDDFGLAEWPDVGVDANGNVTVVWDQHTLPETYNPKIYYRQYDAFTETWGNIVNIDEVSGVWSIQPLVSVEPGGEGMLLWRHDGGATNHIVAVHFNGTSWDSPNNVFSSSNTIYREDVFINENGEAIAAWVTDNITELNGWVGRYDKATNTWPSDVMLENVTGGSKNVQVVLDSNDNAIVTWRQDDGGIWNFWTNTYTTGIGWGTPQLLENDDAGDVTVGVLTIDSYDNVMSFWEHENISYNDLWAKKHVPGSGWQPRELVETNDALDIVGLDFVFGPNGNGSYSWTEYNGTGTSLWTNRYTPPNIPPVADIAVSPSTTGNLDTIFSFDGTGSIDPNGNIVSWDWDFGDFSQDTGDMVSHQYATRDDFIVELNVTDNRGGWDKTTVMISVVNREPVADAGIDQIGSKFNMITLNGTASTDDDGDSFTYDWVQLSGPSVTLNNPNIAKPTFTPSESGTYVFNLTVDDTLGGNHYDTVEIDIVNGIPSADAGADQIVQNNTVVNLNGTASTDPDGDTITFSWEQISGPTATLNNNDTATPDFFVDEMGIYEFKLTVNDGDGGTSSDTVQVIINTHPKAMITVNPGTTGYIDTVFTFDGTSSFDDKLIENHTWTMGGETKYGSTVEHTFPQKIGSWTLYTVTLVVFDEEGLSNSTEILINITNRAPIIETTFSDPTPDVTTGDTTNFEVSATDADGDSLTFTWTLNGVQVGTGSTYAFSETTLGTYELVSTVTDGSASDSVSWTISTSPPPDDTTPEDEGFNWLLLLGIPVFILLLLLLLFLMAKRKKKESPEEIPDQEEVEEEKAEITEEISENEIR
jgi:LPXTG-motif cell wall-anchored protein